MIEVCDYQHAADSPSALQALARETVLMWRQAFQQAMGLTEADAGDALQDQLAYFRRIPTSHMQLARDLPDGRAEGRGLGGAAGRRLGGAAGKKVVGWMVLNGTELEHLYVHVAYQRRGLGRRLLDEAKSRSGGRLQLYAFQDNKNACDFYLSQGFIEVGRGFADAADNPWATRKAQLADVRYIWTAATAAEPV